MMEVIIKGEPKEIAALVAALQERQVQIKCRVGDDACSVGHSSNG